jgi:hypothetical protein
MIVASSPYLVRQVKITNRSGGTATVIANDGQPLQAAGSRE